MNDEILICPECKWWGVEDECEHYIVYKGDHRIGEPDEYVSICPACGRSEVYQAGSCDYCFETVLDSDLELDENGARFCKECKYKLQDRDIDPLDLPDAVMEDVAND